MERNTDRKTTTQAPPARQRKPVFGHDIVVIGGSAGAVEPLIAIVSALPADLAATLFVVIHRSADSPRLLGQLLRREGGLQSMEAVDHLPIEHGIIYVAPPNRHLLVEENFIRIVRGPKENRHRPAIDPLFRSAAWAYGPRVIGILLSGGLNDGTSGLWAVQTCGGTTIVQDPADARFPSIPKSALENMDVDHCVRADEMASLIVRLSKEPAPDRGAYPVPDQIRLESQMVQMSKDDIEHVESIGKLSPFTCPQCHGSLWEVHDEHVLRYRCHTGHAFTAESLEAEEDDVLEQALYSALRALEEGAALSRRLAQRARDQAHVNSAKSLERKALAAERNADVLRNVLYGESDQGNVDGRVAKRAR